MKYHHQETPHPTPYETMMDEQFGELYPESSVTCPACHVQQLVVECFIGSLGRLQHFSCRYCGMQFNKVRQ